MLKETHTVFQSRQEHLLALADDVLVGQAQVGDEQAFRTLYERYFHQIACYLAQIVGKEAVGSELAQETFVMIWQALPDLREPKTFTNWLYRIATHTAYNYHCRNSPILQRSYDEEPALLDALVVEGPESQVEADEAIRMALAQVPLKYRICLVLSHIQGYSRREIAEILSIAESSVAIYIHLALEEFRRNRYLFGKIL